LIRDDELPSDDAPRIALFCGLTGLVAQPLPQIVIPQHLNDGGSEFLRVVTNQDVATTG
jgi:hypothetical protein